MNGTALIKRLTLTFPIVKNLRSGGETCNYATQDTPLSYTLYVYEIPLFYSSNTKNLLSSETPPRRPILHPDLPQEPEEDPLVVSRQQRLALLRSTLPKF